ncbi:hypothetical protein BDB01DRAFT_509116 [Pilobolus umbonatus]|nr:hypothetical protein BDB01DRAFT_509116 [Pilobolus umbonatus]
MVVSSVGFLSLTVSTTVTSCLGLSSVISWVTVVTSSVTMVVSSVGFLSLTVSTTVTSVTSCLGLSSVIS